MCEGEIGIATGVPPPLLCWDTEDVEGWLAEEEIGHYDRAGNYREGPPVVDDDDPPSPFDTDCPEDFEPA